MITSLANVTLIVQDYDDAMRWYVDNLGLELRMDGSMGGDYRFVTVGVKGQGDISIVLHKPTGDATQARSTVQGLLFHCDDCRQQIESLRSKSVKITLDPEEQPWGVQAIIEDLYGNSHVLLEPSPMAPGG